MQNILLIINLIKLTQNISKDYALVKTSTVLIFNGRAAPLQKNLCQSRSSTYPFRTINA